MATMNEPNSRDAVAASSLLTHESIATMAAEAHAHVRTVERRLLGLKVKGRVARRVDEVIARRGISVCVTVLASGATPGDSER